MIDCDIYTASKDALAFCAPHIGRYAMIFFDDWGWPQERGEIGQKEAFEEFLTAHREISAEPMPSYLPQARVFLLKRWPPEAAGTQGATRGRASLLLDRDQLAEGSDPMESQGMVAVS
jgi:hypothetical protein